MPFDLETLAKRFEHVPTEVIQFEASHQAIVDELLSTAKTLISIVPYGNEAEEMISTLVKVGESAHSAIDKIPHPGSVVVGGKVVSEPETAVAGPNSSGVDPEAGVAAAPPSAPAPQPVVESPPGVATGVTKESTLQHIEHELEDFLHVGEHDATEVVTDAQKIVPEAEAVADVVSTEVPSLKPEVAEGEKVATEVVADAAAVNTAVDETA